MPQNAWDPASVPITFINHPNQLETLKAGINGSVRVAVDTETHSLVTFFDGTWASLRVISLALKNADGGYEAFVVDVRDQPSPELASVMSTIKVADGWNVNFDDRVLSLAGCPVKSWKDAMHADGLLHAGFSGFDFWHTLSWAARRYINFEMEGKDTTRLSYGPTNDLSPEQIKYAAFDAIVTLWVAEEIDRLVESAGLVTTVETERASRPCVNAMTVHGFPFLADDWDRESVQVHKEDMAKSLKMISELTGGGALTLFGESNEPSWDVNSDSATRDALNKWAERAVRASNSGQLLTSTDKVDKTRLKLIDHPLAQAVLEYRDHSKVVTTYGENLRKFIDENGRVHAIYRQGGMVATGRLASEKPNAQNLDPEMKLYIRPQPTANAQGKVEQRVFVHADLSQAEVRVLAQLAREQKLIDLFKKGGDFHTLNAGQMFQVDMEELARTNPEKYTKVRKSAKGTSFGIPYGLGAPSLATNLTVMNGVATSVGEAAQYIKAYLEVYTSVAAWLAERDKFISDMAKNPPAADWEATFDLFDLWQRADTERKSFKALNHRYPSMDELAVRLMSDSEVRESLSRALGREATDQDVLQERSRQKAELTWALNYPAPIVLTPDGQPLGWESRTPTGRRRLFTIPVERVSKADKGRFEGVLTSLAISVATTDKPAGAALRDEFAELYNLDLPKGLDRCPKKPNESPGQYRSRLSDFRKAERTSVVKAFEGKNRPLKRELVRFLIKRMGQAAVEQFLLTPALGNQIAAVSNQYRNHPIQGLVTDIVQEAMSSVYEQISRFDQAFPVQQVHDSLAVECFAKDAAEICVIVKEALESAMRKWCPDVPAKADADIRTSLHDKSVLSSEELALLIG